MKRILYSFFFLRWVIRVQEQGLISALRPSLNKDNVKLQLQWEPVNIPLLTSEGKIESKPHIIVHVHKAGPTLLYNRLEKVRC